MIIRIISRNNMAREYNVGSDQVSIGRGPNNNIVVSDPKISRNHLMIIDDGTAFKVRDQGSSNGTYIDGSRIQPHSFYTVGGNSKIRIGNTQVIIDQVAGRTYTAVPVERHPVYNNARGHRLGSELEYANHAGKSFVGHAWLTFFLYWIGFWVGGLIANILNLNSARYTQRIINRDPPGLGCLWALIWLQIIPLAFWIAVIWAILALVGIVTTNLLSFPYGGYY
jgi:hypothetical protein